MSTSATVTTLERGRILEPVGAPSRRQPFTPETLRRNINARVAHFVESTMCQHREPASCSCIQPSNEVMRKYIFSELSSQIVTPDNFNSLFNKAVQVWGIPHNLRDVMRGVTIEELSQRDLEPWKKAMLIVVAAVVAGAVFSGIGVFIYTRIFPLK